MLRSMYSGVAGLKTHQTKMDVIGNNIANVNTVAYKTQSVTFSELMYQTIQNASGANPTTGTAGVNASQVGLGIKLGAINTATTTEGASQTTNNPFDMRITGDSFFIVSNGNDNFFTRDGSFYVDGAGNLAMTSNGYNVMGWQVDPETMDIRKDTVTALRVMSPEHMTYPPEATSSGYVSGILDKNDADVNSSAGKTINMQFYDNLGYSYTAKFTIRSTDVEGSYTVELADILDSNNNSIAGDKNINEMVAFGGGTKVDKATTISLQSGYAWSTDDPSKLQKKDANGSTTDIYTRGAEPTQEEWKAIAEAYNVDTTNPNAFTSFKTYTIHYKNTYTKDGAEITEIVPISIKDVLSNADVTVKGQNGATETKKAGDLLTGATADEKLNSLNFDSMELFGTVELKYDGASGKFQSINGTNSINLALNALDPNGRFSDIVVDFSNTTMFNNSGASTIAATNGDVKGLGSGRKLGNMTGISVSNDGRIYASYDNGQSKLLGQIAVAQFSNPSGLEKEGDNLYKASQNSGDFDGVGVDVKSDGGYFSTGVLEMSNVDLSSEFTEMITTQRGFQANSRTITVSDTLLEELINLKR